MTDYTKNLKVALPVTGQLAGAWGDVVNDEITKVLDYAMGHHVVDFQNATAYTLNITDGALQVDDGRAMAITASNASGDATLTVPQDVSRVLAVLNKTGHVLTVAQGPDTVTIPNDYGMVVVTNGGSLFNLLDFATFTQIEGTVMTDAQPNIDHDSLANMEANEHVDHTKVRIDTIYASGLSGGGDLTASRRLQLQLLTLPDRTVDPRGVGITNKVTVTDGSADVVIEVGAHTVQVGDKVIITGCPDIDTLDADLINGVQTITAVSATEVTFTLAAPFSGTTTTAGAGVITLYDQTGGTSNSDVIAVQRVIDGGIGKMSLTDLQAAIVPQINGFSQTAKSPLQTVTVTANSTAEEVITMGVATTDTAKILVTVQPHRSGQFLTNQQLTAMKALIINAAMFSSTQAVVTLRNVTGADVTLQFYVNALVVA